VVARSGAVIGAVAFGAIGLGLAVALAAEPFPGFGSLWSQLGSTGQRVQAVAVILGCAALAWTFATRRAIEPSVLALALLTPRALWAVVPRGASGEGIVSFEILRGLDDWSEPDLTWGWALHASARGALLVALLVALASSTDRLRRWWSATDEPFRPAVDLWAALVGVGLLVASWATSAGEQVAGDQVVAEPPLSPLRLVRDAPVVDQVVRLAFPLLVVVLVVATSRRVDRVRVQVWVAAAVSAVVLAVVAITGTVVVGDPSGVVGAYEVRPTVGGQLLPLAAAIAFLAAGWLASTGGRRYVADRIEWVSGTSGTASRGASPSAAGDG